MARDYVDPETGIVYRDGPFGPQQAPNPNGPGPVRDVDVYGRPVFPTNPFGQPLPDPGNPFGIRGPSGNPLAPRKPGGPPPGWGGPG